jgi:hypothetical protein
MLVEQHANELNSHAINKCVLHVNLTHLQQCIT